MNSISARRKKRLLLVISFLLAGLWLSVSTACAASSNGAETMEGASEPVETVSESENAGDAPTNGEPRPTLILRDGVVDPEKNTVEVRIDIENNPGITALQFRVHYGDELILQHVEFDSRFGSYVTAPTPYANPQTITFMSPLRSITENGHFATLVFRITDEALPNTTVHLHADMIRENTLDGDLNTVSFAVVNGIAQIP